MDARSNPFAHARATRVRNVRLSLGANLVGALITFLYFSFVDNLGTASEPPPGPAEIAFFVVAFAILGAAGVWIGSSWTRPLAAFAARPDGRAEPDAVVRRRALVLPQAMALIAFTGWVLAGVVWGVGWRLLAGTFAVGPALRSVFGITVVAGVVTTVLIFLLVERQWRPSLPVYFPAGDLSTVTGVVRIGVRARLLAVCLLISVLPPSLVGIIAYTRADAMRGASPEAAAGLISNLVVLVAFITAMGIATSVLLSLHVARSVADPLRDLERGMDRVGRGDLGQVCPVVSADEIGAVAEGFNRMVQGLRERERIRESFGRYVTPEIRDEILTGRLAPGGQMLDVTILFSDLRDFTPWVEATPAADVVRALNSYFTEMEGVIRKHGGLVLQFIGDEIEAVFGAPVAAPDHATMAVRAAMEMRERLAAWNEQRRAAGESAFRHGVGIHTGTVLAGNIGSPERMSYLLVGDPVNLASRIQGLNKDVASDILLSGSTRSRLRGDFPLVAVPATRVKGKSMEVEVWQLR
jgi:class 3 adenylate cyclase